MGLVSAKSFQVGVLLTIVRRVVLFLLIILLKALTKSSSMVLMSLEFRKHIQVLGSTAKKH